MTVLQEGGHIAEILDKETGINPLWTPPWRSSEPSAYGPDVYAEYGAGAESKLLAGIMGHNLCLDIFGGPSEEEAAAGLTVHGEGSVAAYEIDEADGGLTLRARFPMAQIAFERRIELRDRTVRIRECVENLTACDRPIGWTQHVTLGPPFLEKGVTQFRASATRSKVFESEFGVADTLRAAAEFDWPAAPLRDGGSMDLRVLTGAASSCAFTTHLMDPAREQAFFAAFAPRRGWCSGTCGSRPIFRGWASGKRTTAARRRRGMARRWLAAWNSACRRYRNRGGRWSTAANCSAFRRIAGCPPRVAWKWSIAP